MRGIEHDNKTHNHRVCPTERAKKGALRIVAAGTELIERPGLVRRLSDPAQAPVVLLSAPVGYGKSILLSQWAAHERGHRPFAVIDLDGSDNDPTVLWASIIRTARACCPAPQRDRAAPIPDYAYPGQIPPDQIAAVLSSIIEDIWGACPQLILALDNYDAITDPICHQQMAFLTRHLPPQARLVLTTRRDPPLPLARLRACGGLVELGMNELRFGTAEITQIMWLIGGHHISAGVAEGVAERTEGWPAVVHLAARLLRDQPDPGTFLRCFGGSNRYVADYVREEVLRDLPADTQHFLATTSILHRFTAQLCAAVTGTSNSANLLDELERSNLFLVPLDSARTWYRYHRLFGRCLAEQLVRTDPGRSATLHRRASTWYEGHDQATGAIEHAVAAADPEHAAELIERHWAQYVYQGAPTTVGEWLEVLGEDIVSRRPGTAICAAWVSALGGDQLTSHRWLKTAERLGHPGPLVNGMQGLRGAGALYRGAFGFGGVNDMITAARTAAELHTDPASPWYAEARIALGYGRYLAGELRAAVRPLELASRASGAFPVLRIASLSALSLVTGDLGRAGQAADLAATAQRLVVATQLTESSQVTLAQVAHAASLVRTGHPHQARAELEQVVRTCRMSISLPPWPTFTGLLVLARTMLTLGDRSGARALLGEANDLLDLVPDGTDQVRATVLDVKRRLAEATPSAVTARTARLTDREEAVLRLLQGNLPLREVAAQLFVTVNTVKSHTRLIYRKLGASSRTEAIRRARELGLL